LLERFLLVAVASVTALAWWLVRWFIGFFSGGREWYLVFWSGREKEKVVVGCSNLALPLILLLEMWSKRALDPWSCSATSAVD
jgi:hypothetical protein